MKIIITLFILLLFLSCSNYTNSTSRTNEEIKLDLVNIPLIIPAIEAGLSIVDETSVLDITRAFSPIGVTADVDDAAIMVEYFGSGWANETPTVENPGPLTPWEVFDKSGTTGEILRIPEEGFIKGLYNNMNKDFYITMELESGKEYRIELFIYPRDIFNIDYQYIEYYVDEENSKGTWAWSWFNNRGKFGKYAQETTYYRDGTYSVRKSEGDSAVLYTNIKEDAPTLDYTVGDLIENITTYDYPRRVPRVTTEVGYYSSYTSSRVKGTNLNQDVEEYYTEEDVDANDTADFIYSTLYMEGRKRSDDRENVTRYITDINNNITNILSLNTNGNSYTEINRVYKTETVYNSESHVWYTAPSSSLSVNVATSIYNVLTKNGSIYEGTMTQYWGASGEIYEYTINTLTGEITMLWINNADSRALSSIIIDLADLANITITEAGSSWSFKGAFELSELIGTYSYEGFDKDVSIYLEGIEIGSEFYSWE